MGRGTHQAQAISCHPTRAGTRSTNHSGVSSAAYLPDLESALGTASVAAARVTPSSVDSGSGMTGVVSIAMDKVWFILRLTLPDMWMPSFCGIGGGGSGCRRDFGNERDGWGCWPDGARDVREEVGPSRGVFFRRGGGMSGMSERRRAIMVDFSSQRQRLWV